MANSILYLNDPMPGFESPKANTSENMLRKQHVSKQSTESYKYKIAKVILHPWAENQYISHTKGHYG